MTGKQAQKNDRKRTDRVQLMFDPSKPCSIKTGNNVSIMSTVLVACDLWRSRKSRKMESELKMTDTIPVSCKSGRSIRCWQSGYSAWNWTRVINLYRRIAVRVIDYVSLLHKHSCSCNQDRLVDQSCLCRIELCILDHCTELRNYSLCSSAHSSFYHCILGSKNCQHMWKCKYLLDILAYRKMICTPSQFSLQFNAKNESYSIVSRHFEYINTKIECVEQEVKVMLTREDELHWSGALYAGIKLDDSPFKILGNLHIVVFLHSTKLILEHIAHSYATPVNAICPAVHLEAAGRNAWEGVALRWFVMFHSIYLITHQALHPFLTH